LHQVSKILFCNETLHVSWQNKILDTLCILLVIYTKIITMHGHLNIKYVYVYLMFYNFVARKPAQSYHVPSWNNSVVRLPARVKEFCSSPKRPNWLCGVANHRFCGKREIFMRWSSGRCVNVTTNLQLVRKLRIREAKPPRFPHASMVCFLTKHKDKSNFNAGYAYQTSVSNGHCKNASQFSNFTISCYKLYWNKEIAAVSYSSNTCLYFNLY
jgi:hypothetical protein